MNMVFGNTRARQHGMALYNQLLGERLPSSKEQVLKMVEQACAKDREAQKLYPNVSDDDLLQRRRIHFARACGYYLAAKGHGDIRP